MNTVELFSGTKSFSKVAKLLGHKTFTVDNDKKHNPDLLIDIMELRGEDIPFREIDVMWCSPPCNSFSVASIYRHWVNGVPKSDNAIYGRAMLYKTIWFINKCKPKYYFIENPRGMMRKEHMLKWLENNGAIRRTITYCQYGHTVMKPTDIWTNCKEWIPRPMCKNNSICHNSAKRGEDKGIQSLDSSIARGVIPPDLFYEIFEVLEE